MVASGGRLVKGILLVFQLLEMTEAMSPMRAKELFC